MFTLRKTNYLLLNLENLLVLAKANFNSTQTTAVINTKKLLRNYELRQSHFSSSSSRRSFSMTTPETKNFNIEDYDIIGFDLDCTLLRYVSWKCFLPSNTLIFYVQGCDLHISYFLAHIGNFILLCVIWFFSCLLTSNKNTQSN